MQALEKLIRDAPPGKVVAVGECGLDYKRQQFCPPDVQRKYFEQQVPHVNIRRSCSPHPSALASHIKLLLAERTKLPLFLHLRDADDDFLAIVRRNRDRFGTGVVHSFDSSLEVAKELVSKTRLLVFPPAAQSFVQPV